MQACNSRRVLQKRGLVCRLQCCLAHCGILQHLWTWRSRVCDAEELLHALLLPVGFQDAPVWRTKSPAEVPYAVPMAQTAAAPSTVPGHTHVHRSIYLHFSLLCLPHASTCKLTSSPVSLHLLPSMSPDWLPIAPMYWSPEPGS